MVTNSKEQNKNNKYSAYQSFLGAVIYAVLLAYIPTLFLCDLSNIAFEAYSIAAVALFAFSLYKLTSSKRALISFIVPAGILLLLGGSFVVFAVIVSAISSIALLACLLYKADSLAARAFPIIVTVAVYLVISLASGSFELSAICFAALPAAITLALCLAAKTPRVSTVCRVSVALFAPLAILFAVWFFLFNGGDISRLLALIDQAKSFLTDMYAGGMIAIGMAEDTPETFTFAKSSVTLLFNLLPALVITALNIAAYILQSFTATMIATEDTDKETMISLYAFKMSTGSAVVFFVFLILYAVFFDEGRDDLAMAALNVVVILIPGLINTTLVTIKRLTFLKQASCFGVVIYIGAIMLLINKPEFSIIGASIIGAAILVISAARSVIMKAGR